MRLRLDLEFPDAVEPPGLESWVILGEVTGQKPSAHESEMVCFFFISLERTSLLCEELMFGPIGDLGRKTAKQSHDCFVQIGPRPFCRTRVFTGVIWYDPIFLGEVSTGV